MVKKKERVKRQGGIASIKPQACDIFITIGCAAPYKAFIWLASDTFESNIFVTFRYFDVGKGLRI
jgi:hypothetical protein